MLKSKITKRRFLTCQMKRVVARNIRTGVRIMAGQYVTLKTFAVHYVSFLFIIFSFKMNPLPLPKK